MKKIISILVAIILAAAFYVIQTKKPDFSDYKTPKHKKTLSERYMGPGGNLWEIRTYSHNDINVDDFRKGYEQYEAMKQNQLLKKDVKSWISEGPTNVGGRIADIAIDPTNENIIWAATASGGVWKSIDKGQNWNPIFDDNIVLTIGAIALDPTNPEICYVGTGEASASSQSFYGNGIFKTYDGGLTWEFLGLENSAYISRIRVDKNNPQIVWACATGKLYSTDEERGVYKSEDGGQTWTKKLFVSDMTAANDLVIDPTNSDIVYASMWDRLRTISGRISGGVNSGIWKTINGGEDWTRLEGGFPSGETIGRIGLTISEQDPLKLYSVYADYTDSGSEFGAVYKSMNGGETWSLIQTPSSMSSCYINFGWYFSKIECDPKNDNRVFVLGVSNWRTLNGGSSWTAISDYGLGPHVDHHAQAFSLTSDFMVNGNDGGIALSEDFGSNFTEIDFPISQFYDIEVADNDNDLKMGGMQDNGTWLTTNGSNENWDYVLGGDGFSCVINPDNNNIMFAEYQNGAIHRSVDGGQYFMYADDGFMGGDRFDWNTPIEIHPINTDLVYCASQYVYRSDDGNNTGYYDFEWQRISADLSPSGGSVYAVTPAPSDENVIYAGTTKGEVWITTNGGSNYQWNSITNGLPNRAVTAICVDYNNPAIAFISYSGLRWDDQLRYIFKTEDYGQSWTDISSNLPDLPVNNIIIDKNNSDIIYAASDRGIYYTTNGGVNWEMIGLGLPSVPVYDLKINYPSNKLYAGTYGRSMYSIDISELVSTDEENIVQSKEILSNYPNPFNPNTTIKYNLKAEENFSISLYNSAGSKVKELFRGRGKSGEIELNADNLRLASGSYIIRIESESTVDIRKINYIK
ncbi:MAG: T9SS type A sorting domain-containing protein [Candidatus Delongbacteria bacterium]|nr:T9SS type A sorting domain-containing protein [Candidatus Delongbacteria bacterium]MBN2836079.1 T9SS type A sorting domain-containing protein [Candidatus Delongbacteria bacterium]